LFCYDLELPLSFIPEPMDGEVESFELQTLDWVLQKIVEGGPNGYKPNCNLVIIDFLIRSDSCCFGQDEIKSLAIDRTYLQITSLNSFLSPASFLQFIADQSLQTPICDGTLSNLQPRVTVLSSIRPSGLLHPHSPSPLFLHRQGVVTAEAPGYLQLVSSMRNSECC
jgi:hypothetical protein